ncbi:hypothetical protein Mgra_00002005 [Meloidogyne graminicola]|uniref:deoxyhypusine synthase n=1 Tax=Meloidogyne graminicola TaxID=189291 RepID=A0A8S9ZYD0_9BILA|nr:hypothetical protein Mgra_00002005 [Meloidogyne graminicola]
MDINNRKNTDYLKIAKEAVFVESSKLSCLDQVVQGYDFNQGIDWQKLMESYSNIGFQATHLGVSIKEINAMLNERLKPVNVDPNVDEFFKYPPARRRMALTLFLGIFRYILEHNLVDCVVTSAGGVEEDLIKCICPTYLGSFKMSGHWLRSNGVNRAGNLLIPNENYCLFEEWLMPILDVCLVEQKQKGIRWTPSKLIHRLGKEINDKSSICYWAWRNNIPIFCPALTDGSLGDMLYFHSMKNQPEGLIIDIVEVKSFKSGVIILGGGCVKHHINNANLMRNGSDYTVYINTGQEFDGSDSGAEPDEAVSWGKVKIDAKAVKVNSDATLVFPLIVAKTFARIVEERKML